MAQRSRENIERLFYGHGCYVGWLCCKIEAVGTKVIPGGAKEIEGVGELELEGVRLFEGVRLLEGVTEGLGVGLLELEGVTEGLGVIEEDGEDEGMALGHGRALRYSTSWVRLAISA